MTNYSSLRRFALAAARLMVALVLLAAGLAPARPARSASGFGLPVAWNAQGLMNAALSWGDYDADGDLDLLAAGLSDGVPVTHVYRNDGTGSLTQSPFLLTGLEAGGAEWTDFDLDGDLDLAVVGRLSTGPEAYAASVYIYDAALDRFDALVIPDDPGQGLAPLVGLVNGTAAWGDYDADGDPDLLLTGEEAQNTLPQTRLYENVVLGGSRTLRLVPSSGLDGFSDSDAAWCDFDQDGDTDLLLTGRSNAGRRTLIYNWDPTAATFLNSGADLPGLLASSAACGDYDADGDPDLLLAGSAGLQTRAYILNNPSWQPVGTLTGASYPAVAWGDMNEDGFLDAVVAGRSGGVDRTRVYTYNPTGESFSETDAGLTGARRGALALGDANGDGDLDVALAGQSGTSSKAELYLGLNTTPGAGDNSRPVVRVSDWSAEITAGAVKGTDDALIRVVVGAPGPDAETPAAGLTYALRIMDEDGTAWVARPPALPGRPRLSGGEEVLYRVRGLTHNVVYTWSIQAVDASLAASNWIGSIYGVPSFMFLANARPEAGTDPLSAVEDGPTVSVNVLSNDLDPDFETVDPDLRDAVHIVPGSLLPADADPGTPGYQSASGATVTFDEAGGTFSYTPFLNWNGVETFSYLLEDEHGAVSAARGEIRVTVASVFDAPMLEDIRLNGVSGRSFTTLEDTPYTTIRVLSSDVDGHTVRFELIDPSLGIMTPTAQASGDWTYTYTPVNHCNGPDQFTIRAAAPGASGMDYSAEETVNIMVQWVNDAPVAQVATFDLPLTGPTSLTAVDPDNATLCDNQPEQPLHYFLVEGAAYGTVVVDELGGTFTYTPTGTLQRDDAFTFRVWDGTAYSSPAQVTLLRPNNPPSAADAAFDLTEDQPFTGFFTVSDPDGHALSVQDAPVSGPGGGAVSNIHFNPGTDRWEFTYTPNPNFAGNDSFTYRVADTRGGTDDGVITLRVAGVDDAPVFTTPADLPDLREDNALSGTLEASQPPDETQPVTFTVVTPPARGVLALRSNGEYVYTPNLNHNGMDSFQARVAQADGLADTRTFSVLVTQVNDLPVLNTADLPPVAEDTPQLVGNLLPMITDVDNDPALNDLTRWPAQTFTFTLGSRLPPTVLESPAREAYFRASFTAQGGLIYRPLANFYGSESFSFTVTDGVGVTNPELVARLEVTPVNDAPVANPDAVSVPEDSGATTIRVMENDTLQPPVYPDATAPVIDRASPASFGTVEVVGGASLRYTPVPNFSGTDTFSYTLKDGPLESTTTVTVTVTPQPDAPVMARIDYDPVISPGETLRFTLSAADQDNETLVFAASYWVGGVKQPGLPEGAAFDPSTRVFTWTPTPAHLRKDPYPFLFTVTDSSGRTGSGSVQVWVAADLTLAASAPSTVQAGGLLTYTLSVTNPSTGTVTGVVVTAALPQGVTFNPAGSSAGCAAEGQVVTCTLGSLTGGGMAVVSIQAAVPPGTPEGSVLSFSAQAAQVEAEVDASNNAVTAQTTVTAEPPPEPQGVKIFLPVCGNP